jgi:apolipoprotein N-acyltransferase
MSSAARSLIEEKESSPATYIVAFVSGLILSFAFPGRDLFFLAWFCLVPFIIYITECPRTIAFKAGIFFGIPFFFGTQYWIYYSINHYGNLNLVLSILIILLLCLYESLYIGIRTGSYNNRFSLVISGIFSIQAPPAYSDRRSDRGIRYIFFGRSR